LRKSKGQIAIIVIGLISLGLGIKTLLYTRTVILPSWFLVALYTPIVIAISFGLGLLTKKIIKKGGHLTTYASIFATIISLSFYASEFRPTHKILLPENYSGEVTLFLSNEEQNDFEINNYGIGYVSNDTYKNGFKPTVIRNGQDISKQLTNLSSGTIGFGGVDGSTIGPYDYLTFTVPGQKSDNADSELEQLLSARNDLNKLIEINAIDTTRLKRK
jgi:hypothetical protein